MTISGSEKPRVLVVDDNVALVENLSEILEDSDYAVRSAHTIAEADKAATEGFDVALIDVQLPDGDGKELAKRLKDTYPLGEVVLLTGFASVESAAQAVRVGACAYLVKPCATPELLLTVGQAMRQARSHAEKAVLERRARMSEKLAAVGTLTAGLSHEIRNPLNAAGLQLAVLERRIRKLANEQQGPLLDPLTLVRDEIRRLDHILEDFLQFARPREFVPEAIDLCDVVQRVYQLLERDGERRNITLQVDCQSSLLIAGEEGRLRQVLMNLALNAMEASGAGGTVVFTVHADGQDVVLTIDDTGPGIPTEMRDRIFEPFFTTKASGSGLGLPIVNAIITQHGGNISIDSSPSGGARFRIRFPRATK